MSAVVRFRPRTRPAGRAMRVILGTTTRTQIREFCPTANVGVGTEVVNGERVDLDKDIRWVFLPSAPEGRNEVQGDGDWLLHSPEGGFEVLTDAEFNRKYVAE